MPDLTKDKRSREALTVRNERLALLMENDVLEKQFEQFSQASQLIESHVGYGDRVDKFEYLHDDPATARPVSPVSLIGDRIEGKYRPFFETETELAVIRGQARLLELLTPIAFGSLTTLTNYVIGQGWEYEIKPRKGRTISDDKAFDEKVVQRVDDVLQNLLETNHWSGDREREAHRRTHRDGEAFMYLEKNRDGLARFRFAEPENLTEPDMNIQYDLEEYLISQGEMDGVSLPQSWLFGVHTLKRDTETIFGYHFVWNESGTEWDYISKDRVQHIKRNVDRTIKRGISDFYIIRGDLEREAKLRRNTAEGAALQAAIAWIFQSPPGASEAGIQSFISSGATEKFQINHPTGTKTHFQREYRPGSILYPPSGTEYKPGPSANGREAGFEIVAGIVHRAIGRLWDMPEFMISGDASNANYASTLVSVSPFVKAREHDQKFFKIHFKEFLWKALQMAYDAGLLGGMDLTFADLQKYLEIHIDAPIVDSRDKQQEATINQTYNLMGIKSRRTIAKELDLDYDEELERMAEEPSVGITELPPKETFNFATGEASGFDDETLQSAAEQNPQVSGEFADANRRTFMTKKRTVQDVLDELKSGKTNAIFATEMLKSLGMKDERVDALVADAQETEQQVTEALAEAGCGTGSGGFESGNKCAKESGGGDKSQSKKGSKTGSKVKSNNVTVSPGGTIKLKRPKTATEATSMLVTVQSIHDQAMSEVAATRSLPLNHPDKNKATLRLAHTTKQLDRASRMAAPLLKESLHESVLESMSAKQLVMFALDSEWEGYP